MATRVSIRALLEHARTARLANPGVAVTFAADARPGNKKLVFTGRVTIGADEYDLAGDNGKIKSFSQIDDYIKYVAQAAPISNGTYSIACATGTILAASIPSDLKKDAQNKIVQLNRRKTAQQAVLAAINAELTLMAGWENGNALQAAKKAETEVQKTVVTNDISAIDAQITRYQAVVGG